MRSVIQCQFVAPKTASTVDVATKVDDLVLAKIVDIKNFAVVTSFKKY